MATPSFSVFSPIVIFTTKLKLRNGLGKKKLAESHVYMSTVVTGEVYYKSRVSRGEFTYTMDLFSYYTLEMQVKLYYY